MRLRATNSSLRGIINDWSSFSEIMTHGSRCHQSAAGHGNQHSFRTSPSHLPNPMRVLRRPLCLSPTAEACDMLLLLLGKRLSAPQRSYIIRTDRKGRRSAEDTSSKYHSTCEILRNPGPRTELLCCRLHNGVGVFSLLPSPYRL